MDKKKRVIVTAIGIASDCIFIMWGDKKSRKIYRHDNEGKIVPHKQGFYEKT